MPYTVYSGKLIPVTPPGRGTRNTHRRKEWAVIVVVAVLLHLVLFLSVKPGFFNAFRHEPSAEDGAAAAGGMPRAIITIPIEIDESEEEVNEQPVTEVMQDRQPKEVSEEMETPDPAPKPADDDERAETLDDLLGATHKTRPGNLGQEAIVIPPRPVEITWPDTRRLKHCLGQHIDVRIHVAKDGRIITVEVPEGGFHPPDCLEAAMASARQIVFDPGQIDGQPAALWTEVRIEFRKKQ